MALYSCAQGAPIKLFFYFLIFFLFRTGVSSAEVSRTAGAGAAASHRGAQEQRHGQEAPGGGQEEGDREGRAGEAGGHTLQEQGALTVLLKVPSGCVADP